MSAEIKVLIADDQSSIRGLLKMIVGSLGGNVVAEAGNGVEAVEKFKQHSPDLVLLDINMPQMDGVEALQAIKQHNTDAVVAMLTSQNTVDVVRKCVALGAVNFILKDNPDTIQQELAKLWSSINV